MYRKKGNTYILASETAALNAADAEFIRDVLPGEVVMIDEKGIHSDNFLCTKRQQDVFLNIFILLDQTRKLMALVSTIQELWQVESLPRPIRWKQTSSWRTGSREMPLPLGMHWNQEFLLVWLL